MKTKRKFDAMLLSTFLTTLFYSATYPYIHKVVMIDASDSLIAIVRIIDCISIVISGTLWNKKSGVLFRHYPFYCISETILSIILAVWTTISNNIIGYYLFCTLIVAVVTRNISCGGIRLRAMRYATERERECFDNNDNSVYAISTIIGSVIAMALNLDFNTMLWIATIGGAIDNMFFLGIFYSEMRRHKTKEVESMLTKWKQIEQRTNEKGE